MSEDRADWAAQNCLELGPWGEEFQCARASQFSATRGHEARVFPTMPRMISTAHPPVFAPRAPLKQRRPLMSAKPFQEASLAMKVEIHVLAPALSYVRSGLHYTPFVIHRSS